MSKVKLLLDVVSNLHVLADSIQAVADTIGQNDQHAHSPAPDTPKTISVKIEQVRAVLAEKSQSGKRLEVQELLKKYGESKLSAISPDKYPELLKDAELL